jgi:hypothetical protein
VLRYRITGRSLNAEGGVHVCTRREGNPRDHDLICWYKVLGGGDAGKFVRVDLGTLLQSTVLELKRRESNKPVYILTFQTKETRKTQSKILTIWIEQVGMHVVRELRRPECDLCISCTK